jgi:hypothetical protein
MRPEVVSAIRIRGARVRGGELRLHECVVMY